MVRTPATLTPHSYWEIEKRLTKFDRKVAITALILAIFGNKISKNKFLIFDFFAP